MNSLRFGGGRRSWGRCGCGCGGGRGRGGGGGAVGGLPDHQTDNGGQEKQESIGIPHCGFQMVRWPVAGQLMPEDSRQWSFILNLTKKSNYIRFAEKSHIRYSIGKSRNS